MVEVLYKGRHRFGVVSISLSIGGLGIGLSVFCMSSTGLTARTAFGAPLLLPRSRLRFQ